MDSTGPTFPTIPIDKGMSWNEPGCKSLNTDDTTLLYILPTFHLQFSTMDPDCKLETEK